MARRSRPTMLRWTAIAAIAAAAAGQKTCPYKNAHFHSLNLPAGHPVDTPVGKLHINPCMDVAACATLTTEPQAASSCCLSTNFTTGSKTWSCGKTGSHIWTEAVDDPALKIGMIQTFGSDCGYILEPDKQMQLTVAFECDKKETGGGKLTLNEVQDTYCNFNVTWVTSAACDLPDAPGRPSSLASDWGTHFLLIFFGAVIVYCGLGTFIKSRLPNHSDACYNNIPQRDFWFDLPSLSMDGTLFAVSGGKRKANKHGTYESIDSADHTVPTPPRKNGKVAKDAEAGGGGGAADDAPKE